MRSALLCSGALLLTSSVVLAQRAPESILPPGLQQPAPAPTASPTPAPTPSAAPSNSAPPAADGEVVQPVPSVAPATPAPPPVVTEDEFANIPSVRELENMNTDELDELLGLKPKVDIPPAAQRSLDTIGVLGAGDGGLPQASLARQPAGLVRAALAGIRGPVISRWGHILLRRALASRLAAPEGMDPVAFATLRTNALNRLGEHAVARALVQNVDNANYDTGLTDAAIDAYVGTADIVGACPIVRLDSTDRETSQWRSLRAICNAYAGESQRAQNDLRRLLSRTSDGRVDVFLAQRYAAAAGQARRAVTIEWDDVDELTPWRFALANAVGEPIPDTLLQDAGPYYLKSSAIAPMLPAPQRLRGGNMAAGAGILSANALIDLYSQLYADEVQGGVDPNETAARLRTAYVAPASADRVAAIRGIWGQGEDYGSRVLTAYAAARVTPSDAFANDAGDLIGSMLTAGLDRNAIRWQNFVADGSLGWALLALATPNAAGTVSEGDVDSFVDADNSSGQRKAKMLVAGLAGLGRLDEGSMADLSDQLGVNLVARTRFTRVIDQAAAAENRVLVAYLAGLGMQGDSWDQMTARQLYHIVAALNRVGLNAEARMIAAEAVSRA